MSLNKSKGNMYNWKLPDINTLKDIYFNQKMSFNKIARIYGVTTGAVKIKFNRYGIKPRSLSKAQELNAHHFEVTPEIIYFFDGLLLGDGCVCLHQKNKKSGVYGHTDKNYNFIVWLKEQLSRFNIHTGPTYHAKNNTYHFNTRYYREFVEFRHRWYPNGKKVIPKDIILMPNTLKNWYLGDGSYKKGKNGTKGGEIVIICSEFDPPGKILMMEQLVILGINCSIYSHGIYIKAQSRLRFFKYMLLDNNEIPDCYLYKFPVEITNAIK